MTVILRPRAIARALAVMLAVLIAASFAAQFLKWKERGLGVARFFDSDQKVNFPTGYKILTLVAAAVTIWLIARAARDAGDRFARQWLVLAGIVGFLALDETASIHQSLGNWLRGRFDTSGVLHFAWVIVYAPAMVAVAAYLWRFFWSLETRTRWPLALGGALFGGGSAVSALIKGAEVSSSSHETLSFYLTAAVSDTFEMVGLAVILVVALRELSSRVDVVRFEVAS